MKHSKLAQIFKALSCQQRLELFELIHSWQGIDPCCDGVRKAFTMANEKLNISRSTLSHHFKELENAGLIRCKRNGQAMECYVNEELVKEIQGFLK